jgi:hypothetical protein
VIKDTSVFQTFSVTVSLTDGAPAVRGFGYFGPMDPIEFQPHTVEVMWIKPDGKGWELREARVKGRDGFLSIGPDHLLTVPWVREIVDEVRPTT